MHKRVLLKFSGEQLAGKYEFGIDKEVAHYIALECKKVIETGCQLVLIIGGGNMARGADIAGRGIKRVTGDQMGMIAGLMNSIALTDILESEGVATRCTSNIFAEQVAESYSFRLAEKHLEHKRVVIVAGGLGRPYITHDTAAVNLALELSCDVVLKATKFDGVYDKDPALYPDAKRFESISHQAAVENSAIKVMDKAALALAMEQNMPLIVFDAMKQDNLLIAVKGEPVGTRIS